jgi:hypothetical protein
MRFKTAEIGPAVDAMLRDQFERLIKPLGKVVGNDTAAKPAAEEGADAPKPEKATDLEAAVNEIEPEKTGEPEKVEPDEAGNADQPE